LAWQSGSWICVCNFFAADYLFMGSTYCVPGRHNVATLGQTVMNIQDDVQDGSHDTRFKKIYFSILTAICVSNAIFLMYNSNYQLDGTDTVAVVCHSNI